MCTVYAFPMGEKQKTSVNLTKDLWGDWVRYVVNKTGSTKTISNETELALKEYMKEHPLEKKGNGE